MKKSVAENNSTHPGREEAVERIEGVRVGRVAEVDDSGRVFVDYTGNTQGRVAARFTSSVKLEALRRAASEGRDILLVFENNDPLRPVIIDTLSSLTDEIVESGEIDLQVDEPEDVTVDGRRITFDAKDQIVLKCGKASITLTRAGKVIIRGAYLLSRSSGVNRIKGGSVQIN
ncbi:MAG: hypothetical protein GXP46_10660 [Deferribacteres bacterium]|nr:hypothetical protein [Deferribacteres bacterium]